ncbi:gamma-glutamylcyclotransferase-like [Arctopsyche grandis]|uniref:gamma-glutamylcyclotransferase-like n=1 Tax=Arctopsyche grandis TaxID=121162 RepID=UPI00406D7014
MSVNKSFMYFSYGSNLLSKRIHIQNPTALRKHVGQLKDHRLDFIGHSLRWGGAPATIVPHVGESVWGAIWEIDMKNLPDLDDQEGVAANIYFPRTVDIHLIDGQVISCRTYQRTVDPPDGSNYPADKPSRVYLSTILHGAIESELPKHYIEKLETLPHNNNVGEIEMESILEQL